MFATDSFINAEISYRNEKLRKEWGTFGRRTARRTRTSSTGR